MCDIFRSHKGALCRYTHDPIGSLVADMNLYQYAGVNPPDIMSRAS